MLAAFAKQFRDADIARYIIPSDEVELKDVLNANGATCEVRRGLYRNREVAVKTIPVQPGTHLEAAITREVLFYVHATQECKQICKFYGVTEKPGRLCLVMKLYPNNLTNRIGKGLPLKDAIKLGLDIAKALIEVHSLNYIINDLKPDNVLIDALDDAILADFGIARLCATSGFEPSTLQGTPKYMSPEAIVNSGQEGKKVDCKTDIWSFGCTMIHMLTGAAPYPDTTNYWTVVYKVGHEKITPEIPQGLPDNVKQLLQACFQRIPEARPTAQHLYRALQQCSFELHASGMAGDRIAPLSSPSSSQQPAGMSPSGCTRGQAHTPSIASLARADSMGGLSPSSQPSPRRLMGHFSGYRSLECSVNYGSVNCSLQSTMFLPEQQSLRHEGPLKRLREAASADVHAQQDVGDPACSFSDAASDASEAEAQETLVAVADASWNGQLLPVGSQSWAQQEQQLGASGSYPTIDEILQDLCSDDPGTILSGLGTMVDMYNQHPGMAFDEQPDLLREFSWALTGLLQQGHQSSPAVISYAAELIGKMAAASEDDADSLVRDGILSSLGCWLTCSDTPILIQVCTAMRTLCSQSDRAKRMAREDGAVPLLAQLMPHPVATVAIQAAGAMKNISCDDDNKKYICSQQQIMGHLRTALGHASTDVQLEASAMISNLAADEVGRSVLVQSQCFSSLARLTEQENHPVRQVAVAALQRMSTDWQAQLQRP